MSFLYNHNGKRKYLTVSERGDFLRAARKAGSHVYTFCATIAYTGARISEVLALVPEKFDLKGEIVAIECLKKRRPGTYRAVPMPPWLLRELDEVHMIRGTQNVLGKNFQRLWPWSRTTAWKHVKGTMTEANIFGPQACPKGLRHGFAIASLQAGVPLNLVKKWLGHSRLATTEIYTDAVGAEEQYFARRLWAITSEATPFESRFQ